MRLSKDKAICSYSHFPWLSLSAQESEGLLPSSTVTCSQPCPSRDRCPLWWPGWCSWPRRQHSLEAGGLGVRLEVTECLAGDRLCLRAVWGERRCFPVCLAGSLPAQVPPGHLPRPGLLHPIFSLLPGYPVVVIFFKCCHRRF